MAENVRHKCYISFKMKDEDYKKTIGEDLGDSLIDKSLNDPIDSEDEDYIMRKIREDYLSDSTVTTFLIGKCSNENLGYDGPGKNFSAGIRSFHYRCPLEC